MELLNNSEEILNKILSIQIDAYKRIASNNLDWEDKWFLMQFQSSEKELQFMAQERVNFYLRIQANPALIYMAPDDELATMRHILFRMEDTWLQENYEGVKDCWELFFSIEEQRKPRIKYIKKQIKFTRK